MEPLNELQTMIESEKAVEDVVTRVQGWQEVMSPFFTEFEEYASAYRLLDSGEGQRSNSYTKTRVGETIRSTEALTTSIFRMMTSADPCYDLVSMNGSQTPEQVYAAWLMLRYQDQMMKWKRNLLRSTRGLCLFGTQIIEKPWIQKKRNGQLMWEGLGFVPRSLLQCAFDPYVLNIQESPWIAFLDYKSKDQLLDLADTDPDHWNPQQIELAVDSTANSSSASTQLETRRRRAGYREAPPFEVITYYGRLRDHKREDGKAWCLRLVNEKTVISAYGNPSPIGELPFGVGTYLQFELEPYGYGVGRLGRMAQRHMDENRKRYMDIARMSLMNMWIKDRLSGVKNSDLKIKPLGIIEADDINLLKPFYPDLNAIDVGFKIEEISKNEFQGNSGASVGLQAQVTEASATEASIAQNEAIRRVSVIAEDVAEPFVRDYQMEKHEYNLEWLETDLYIAVSGMEKPQRVNRSTIAPMVNITAKVTTDKDFRPARVRNLLEAWKVLTSIRNRQNIQIDDLELAKEIFNGLDVNSRKVIRDPNDLAPGSVLNFLAANMNAAKQAAGELGPEIEGMGGGGSPAQASIMTGAGPVLASPGGEAA